MRLMLTDLEKRIIASIQGDMPITERPFLQIAEHLGIDEAILLEKLKDLWARGIIRRFGATLRHQKSGFEANAMVAWQVEAARIEEVGKKLASFREVSHCYCREPAPQWPYNLYTMIHAADEEACVAIARTMAAACGVDAYTLLFSRRELKKTSMKYFPMTTEG